MLTLPSTALCGLVTVLVVACHLSHPADAIMRVSKQSNLATRSSSETLPNFQARMFKGGIFSWELETKYGNTYIRGTFNYSGDFYAGIGLRSDKKMRGPIVICYINSTVEINAYADCNDYYGGDFDMQSAPQVSEVIEAVTDGKGDVSITFRRIIHRTNLTGFDPLNQPRPQFVEPEVSNQDNGDVNNVVQWEDFYRVIFAKGKFLDGASRPKQHDADDMSAFLINFNSGEVTKMTSYNHVIVMGVAVGFGVLLWLAFAIWGSRIEITPLRQKVTIGIAFAYFTFMASMYTLANFIDYKATVVSKSHVRSLGDGASFLLVASLLPVARQVAGTFHINSSYGVLLHVSLSMIMLGFTFCHAIGMWYYFGDECLRWRDKDNISKLPGIFAFVLMCIIAISAVFRNKSPILWTLFRLSHYIYVVALFFAVCHYPKLAYGLAGPVLVYLIEAVINHIYNPAPEQTDITLAACEDSKCTLLRVHSTHTAGSSDYTYYYLQIPQISRAWHPFFISLPLSWDPSDPHIEFLIKNTDFVYGEFWSQAKGNVPKAGQRNSHAESRSVEGSGSWTSKLYHLALNKTPIESIRFQGPFGQPHLRMTSASNSLFICGGVGIAPVLSCLYTFATGMDEISGNIDRQGSVSMVWVISDASLLNLYGSHLARVRCHLAYLAPKTIVNFSIYITNSTAVAHCCSKKNVGGGHKKNRRKASDLEEPLGSDHPPPQERSEIVVSLPPEFQQELLIHIGSRPHWMEALKPVHAIIGAQMKRAALEADERDGSSSSSRSKKKKAEGSNEADPLGFELEDKGEAEALELCHLLTPNDMRKGVMSLKDCSVYMCGPDGLAEESQAALETLEKAGGEAGPQYLFYQEPFAH